MACFGTGCWIVYTGVIFFEHVCNELVKNFKSFALLNFSQINNGCCK